MLMTLKSGFVFCVDEQTPRYPFLDLRVLSCLISTSYYWIRSTEKEASHHQPSLSLHSYFSFHSLTVLQSLIARLLEFTSCSYTQDTQHDTRLDTRTAARQAVRYTYGAIHSTTHSMIRVLQHGRPYDAHTARYTAQYTAQYAQVLQSPVAPFFPLYKLRIRRRSL